jgi:hypothetical protein
MTQYYGMITYDNEMQSINTCNYEAEERKLKIVHNQRPLRMDLRREYSQNEMTG